MLVPTPRLIGLALAWCALGVVVAIAPGWLWSWQLAGVVWIGTALADGWMARHAASGVTLRRELARTLPVGVWHQAAVVLTAPRRPISGRVQEGVPAGFESQHDGQSFRVPAGRTARLSYRLRPLERGTHRFGPATLRFESPLGCWAWQCTLGPTTTARVYPDFARIVHYTLLATDHRLSQLGVLQRQRRGQGAEFHQLRDYRQDDSPRQIDWSATARLAKLIAREYEDERDQQIVLVLDASQRMRAKDGDLSHFDHSLNAVLLLAYVALRQGDSVGLASFGHDAPRFLAPRASLATLPRLLNALFEIQPSLQVPDYAAMAVDLRRRLSRRALVLIATAVGEEDGPALRLAVKLLSRRHSVVVASLREWALDAARASPITTLDAALEYAAALDYLERRRRTLAALRHEGVTVLEARPPELARLLVNHYWERKRAGAA